MRLKYPSTAGHGAEGGAHHRFGDEGHDLVRADALDFGFELVGHALAVVEFGFVLLLAAVGITGRDVRSLDHQRCEGFASPLVTAGGKGAERIAVVGLAARDQAMPLGFADFEIILARELDRGLDCFRTAGDEVNPVQRAGRLLDQQFRQCFGRHAAEKTGVRELEPVELGLDRFDHARVAVPETGHRGAAGCVEIVFAGAVDQVDAVTLDGQRQFTLAVTRKYVAHGVVIGF